MHWVCVDGGVCGVHQLVAVSEGSRTVLVSGGIGRQEDWSIGHTSAVVFGVRQSVAGGGWTRALGVCRLVAVGCRRSTLILACIGGGCAAGDGRLGWGQ